MTEAFTNTDLQGALPLVARGKVRDLYEVDEKTLLFIATDRISAYDVIMENVSLSSSPAINAGGSRLNGYNRVFQTKVFS